MLFGLFVAPQAFWTEAHDVRSSHPAASDLRARDFGLLAQGLQLLLNRCNEDLLDGALHDAVIAHGRITFALRHGRAVRISVEIVRDVARVIEPFVDRATLEAARRCVEHIEADC